VSVIRGSTVLAIMRCNLLSLFYVRIKHETSCVRLENFVYTISEGDFSFFYSLKMTFSSESAIY
jgi:hypothetical protein